MNNHEIGLIHGLVFPQSIGQAYDDMQNQNQHLLQQITERDDYNIKVIIYPSIFL
jgi:hypothetical protein